MTSTTIDPKHLYNALQAGTATLIDVREPDEFAREHIPFAASMPLARIGELLKDMPSDGRSLVFQCQRGKRGEQACHVAQGLQGRDVRNLEGGIDAWKIAGLPIVTASKSGLPIMRQVQIAVGALIATNTALGFSGWMPGFALAGLLGVALMMAGITGWCGMAMLLARMPWNR